ncbi:MAG: type II secretion system protein [Rhabdochlamydiaceae bacterium]|nr:type II secretion system protein [Candidatus Amphrikana amoebophyrae]
MKKRAITLIEVLVGFTLFTILIGSLMLSFSSMTMSNAKLSFEKEYESKLQFVSTNIGKHFDKLLDQKEKTFTLNLDQNVPKLSFISCGHIDRNPLFFNKRIITLTHQNNTFVLIEQSPKDKTQLRVTHLLSGVDSIGFTFVYLDSDPEKERIIYKTKALDKVKLPFAIEIELGLDRSFTFLVPTDLIKPFTMPMIEED